jgi:hypothetical protein
MSDWSELTTLTQGRAVVIERVKLAGSDVRIEGQFDPPPLAALSAEDQVFVAAFVRSHGSIKEMEKLFGVSYPTVKARLNRIGEALDFVAPEAVPPPPDRLDILDRLARGELSVDGAVEEMKA